ncbi:hypothetical protein Dfri01_26760 [Dyadobacter frigoris]|nr:hypothetical protein Dfri01_26760 [Dyadobacter frigoris]
MLASLVSFEALSEKKDTISINYKSTTAEIFNIDFDTSFKLQVSNFDNAAKIKIEFDDGEADLIDAKQVDFSVFSNNQLYVTFTVEENKVFLKKDSQHNPKAIKISNRNGVIIAEINKKDPSGIPIIKPQTTDKPTGHAYLDAMAIIKSDSIDDIISILSTYFDSIPQNVNSKEMLIAFLKKDSTNLFLNDKKFIDLINKKLEKTAVASSTAGFIKGTKTNIGSIGGLDVTKFANAISDLLIDRAKQELTVAFFDRFKKFSEKNPEFQILFPKSTDNLSKLLTYQYPQMLPALRTGFLDDLRLITYHLDDVLELPRYRELLINFPEIRVAIKSLRLIHALENGTSNLAEVIREFSEFPEWDTNPSASPEFKNMKATVTFTAIFSEALRSDSASKDSTIWITPKQAQNFVNDPVNVQIFMGLLYQQIKNKEVTFIINGHDKTLTKILEEQKESIFLFQSKISEFINLADKFSYSYREVSRKIKNKEKPTNENIYNYINVSLDVIDYGFSVVKIFDKELLTDQFITIPRKANSLYKDIYSEQYTQAVNDAVDLLKEVYNITKNNTVYPDLVKAKQEERTKNIGDSLKIDIDIKIASLKKREADANTNLNNLITFAEKVKPYALFMANMVEAKDEDAIKAALENVILPVGSSSIKKNQEQKIHLDGNVSIQSYVGASWRPFGNPENSKGTMSDRFGVIAPIGVSYTPGFASLGKSGSVSLFISLLDLGAIVDYKLKIDSTVTSTAAKAAAVTKNYSIELGQIFSPGGFLVYGFGKNLPLSLGIGAQFGPGLSKIDVSGSTIILNEPKWRFKIFLAVDLPLFTLRNRLRSSYTPIR